MREEAAMASKSRREIGKLIGETIGTVSFTRLNKAVSSTLGKAMTKASSACQPFIIQRSVDRPAVHNDNGGWNDPHYRAVANDKRH
jgi:hypothetical protein